MKKIRVIFCVIIFMTGLGIASYPFISNMVAQRHASQVVKDYETNVEEMDEEKIDAMKEAAKKYNEQLSNVVSVDDENENNEQGESYADLLNIGESLGYITIPKIDVNLPIYNGTSQDVLSKGVGHMEQSSYPLGGESTHCVLTGHRGLPSAKIFTDLDQMKNGDIFLIHVLGKTLAYKVDQIKTVLPEESSELDIVEGEDHVTLVTCTPYGVNTHRLLIRGIRTEYVEPEEKAEETPIQQIAKVDPVKIMIIGLVAMVIMIIIVYIVIRRKSRKTEESSRKDE